MDDGSSQRVTSFSIDEIKDLRREAGCWLKELREKRGLSQLELQRIVAPSLRSKYVSQVEIGRLSLSSIHYEVWAKALQVDPRKFAQHLLKYYNPCLHYAIFEHNRIKQ